MEEGWGLAGRWFRPARSRTGLGDVGHVGHPVAAGKFRGGFGQVVRAVGLAVLPVEERLFTDRVPLAGLGPVERAAHVALAVGGDAEQVPAAVSGPGRGDDDVGRVGPRSSRHSRAWMTAQPVRR